MLGLLRREKRGVARIGVESMVLIALFAFGVGVVIQ
jgi:hypothetical protein